MVFKLFKYLCVLKMSPRCGIISTTMQRIILILISLYSVVTIWARPLAVVVTDDSIVALQTAIFGPPEADADRMYLFVKSRNSNFSREVAEAFLAVGQRYGIRGDIALCQAILETGWFRFMDGTMVTPDQYNYGGLGVTGNAVKGNTFTTMEEGVTALIQHLYAYACRDELPEGELLVDQRFKLVNRGSAPTWGELSGRWAMNPQYGRNIMRLYRQMSAFEMPAVPTEPEVKPDTTIKAPADTIPVKTKHKRKKNKKSKKAVVAVTVVDTVKVAAEPQRKPNPAHSPQRVARRVTAKSTATGAGAPAAVTSDDRTTRAVTRLRKIRH